MFDFLKRLNSKAVTGATDTSIGDLFKIIQGDAAVKNYTAQDLVKLNRGWVAICNNKNSLTIATTPLHLYYNNKFNKQIKLNAHKEVSKKDINFIHGTISDSEVKQSDNIVEILEHDFLTLIKNVNPEMNYVDMVSLIEQYLGILGNAYLHVVYGSEGSDGKPVELWPLLSENCSVLIGSDGKVSGYKYVENIIGSNGVESQKVITYKPEEIVHFKNYKTGSTLYGIGELEQCLAAVERMNYYDLFESYLNKNFSRNDFVVSYRGKYTEKELRDAYKQWAKKFGGIKNAGKPLITSGELDIKTLGYAPRDMEFKDGRSWGMSEIAAMFGVPESLIKLNDANRASSVTSTLQYYKFTLVPKIRSLCEKLNEQLLPKYDSNLFVWYSEKDFLTPEAMTYADIMKAVELGILGVDEARNVMGYEIKEEEENNEEQV